jgi:hypothetical protein
MVCFIYQFVRDTRYSHAYQCNHIYTLPQYYSVGDNVLPLGRGVSLLAVDAEH